MSEIIQFKPEVKTYTEKAKERIKEKKYISALSLLFSGLKIHPKNVEILLLISSIYEKLGETQLASSVVFYCLSIAKRKDLKKIYTRIISVLNEKNDLMLSGYYLKLLYDKKLMGLTEAQTLTEEYLSMLPEMKDSYSVIYHDGETDYSSIIEKVFHFASVGAHESVIKTCNRLPSTAKNKNIFMSQLIACIALQKMEEAHLTCEEVLESLGEGFTTNLCYYMYFSFIDNKEKEKYYYRKLVESAYLEQESLEKEEILKLFTCAKNMDDKKTIIWAYEKGSKTFNYRFSMVYEYAIALLNSEDFVKARETFGLLYKMCPFNEIFKFYFEFSLNIQSENKLKRSLPLEYEQKLPSYIEEEYLKTIKQLRKGLKKNSLKSQQVKSAIKWGLVFGDIDVMDDCLAIIYTSKDSQCIEFLKLLLVDSNFYAEKKHQIIYSIIANRVNFSFKAILGGLLCSYKPRKFTFEDNLDADNFILAYANVQSQLMIFVHELQDSVFDTTEYMYSNFREILKAESVSVHELAALILYESLPKEEVDKLNIEKMFNVGKRRFKQLKQIIKDKKDDKNN